MTCPESYPILDVCLASVTLSAGGRLGFPGACMGTCEMVGVPEVGG